MSAPGARGPRRAGLLAAAAVACLAAANAAAQPPAVPDVPRPKPTRVVSTYDPGRDRDRFEVGVGAAKGYFDVLGTIGFRCFVRERTGWIQNFQVQASGSQKSHLTAATVSLYYLLRPRFSDRPGWAVRPILEGGVGTHLTVEGASMPEVDETAFHARAYLKTHFYLGGEFLATDRIGIAVRGRMTLPEYRPLDYAEAVIFLR